MSNTTYQIYYFDGLKPGIDELQATQQLAELLKITDEKARKLILASNRVVKGGLTQEQAEKYILALDIIGMQVKMLKEEQVEEELSLVEKESEEIEQESHIETTQPPELIVAPARMDQSESSERVQKDVAVEFNGKGMEYFKIWIVNIFLTILTLGIYSAWAKVRNKQYFYGNTVIDGSSFQYTASPIAILKGRLIAVAVFIVYTLVVKFVPILAILFALAFLLIIPWLIVRSLAFNARNSMYRNIRFNFTGKTMDALKVFVLWPILIPLTLGFILPLTWFKQTNFIVTNSAYGTTPFSFNARVGSYYQIFFIMLGGVLGLGIITLILSLVFGALGVTIINYITPVALIVYFLLIAYLITALANLHFNSTQLANHGFTSTLQFGQVVWLYFTNMLVVLITLGLMIPWAQVRMAKYRASCLRMQVDSSLDDFVAAEQQNVSALGEEMGDVFDVEVSYI
jgi:uncharacterized membrane protein YjgN (DUF898 family)